MLIASRPNLPSGMPVAKPRAARLYTDMDMSGVEVLQAVGGDVAVCSARCPGKETPNEDAAAIVPVDDESAVLIVADGAGGLRGGERAAFIAVEALKASVAQAAGSNAILRTAILNGMEVANRWVQELGIGAATTLAVVEIRRLAADATRQRADGSRDRPVRWTARPYHVGDSMVLVTGQRGKVKLQTVSHSPVGFAVESGLLDESEAMHHDERHLVSNFVGMPDMRIEVGSTLTLAPRDTLLLASDGLFDNLHFEEIVDRIRKGLLAESVSRAADDARARMTRETGRQPSKPDDLTIVAFRPPAGSRQ